MTKAGRAASCRSEWKDKPVSDIRRRIEFLEQQPSRHVEPYELSDGERVLILRDILRERENGDG